MRILLLAAALVAQLAPSDGAPRISQAEFKKLRATKKVVIVDTRTRDAYDSGHIPGAILLPVEGRQTSRKAPRNSAMSRFAHPLRVSQ